MHLKMTGSQLNGGTFFHRWWLMLMPAKANRPDGLFTTYV